MPEKWDKRFALYAVALCRCGNFQEAALVGCIMFEKAIYHLLKEKGISEQNISDQKPSNKGEFEYALNEACKHYTDEDKLKDFTKNELHEIRRRRNDIIHSNKDINDIDGKYIKRMILFIWWIYDKSNYEKYNGTIKEIKFLKADYIIREILRELEDPYAPVDQHDFEEFEMSDFEDLQKMRKKFVFLESKIKNFILDESQNELDIDSISRVDTTSAYVWMGLNKGINKKNKINSASPSILATPLDLRIYLDFGGKAYQERRDYYKFLKSDIFTGFKKRKDLKDITIFDIDWYSFIIDKTPLFELTEGEMDKKINHAETKLNHDEQKNNIISWNRVLLGYIIDRRKIGYNEIKEKLNSIITLYYYFDHYRSN
mgnify:FL=1